MKKKLTDKQLAVLAYACDFFRRNDQLPGPTALAKYMGYTSSRYPSAATRILAAIAAKGYIERNECGGYRFVRENQSA